MRITEEFKIKNSSGHEVILQSIGEGISYLDFGNTHLPRSFKGYRVKYTDKVAEPIDDGVFTIHDSDDDSDDVYRRV